MEKMTVVMECPFCRQVHEVEVGVEDYFLWRTGEKLAQEVFTYLTPTEREQLISGICPSCQEMVFSEDVEEEEEDITAPYCSSWDCPYCKNSFCQMYAETGCLPQNECDEYFLEDIEE